MKRSFGWLDHFGGFGKTANGNCIRYIRWFLLRSFQYCYGDTKQIPFPAVFVIEIAAWESRAIY